MKFAGTSAGCSAIFAGSMVESFCPATGIVGDVYPAMPAQGTMATDRSTIIREQDDSLMGRYDPAELLRVTRCVMAQWENRLRFL